MNTADQQIADILVKYGEPITGNIWRVQGQAVIYHKALERIAAQAGIAFGPPTILRAERDEAVIVVTGSMGERTEWSIGEALAVTAAIAMAISRELGGEPALTAVLVIITGILGAVSVTPLFNALRIKPWEARGFAVGLASHGIGTARAFQVNPVAGLFAGLAMALNAVLTALIVPPLLHLIAH